MFIRILFVLVVSGMLGLTGCSTVELPFTSSGIEGPPVSNTLTAMPDDAARAVTSVVHTPTGADSDLLPGFTMQDARLYRYQMGESPDVRLVDAVADFEDQLGRRYQSRITARYQVDGDRVRVLESSSTPYFGTAPRTTCFIMPIEQLPCFEGGLPSSYASFYQQAATAAVTPEQASSSSQERNWAMTVFFLDRVSPSAKIELGVSSSGRGEESYTKDSRYVDYNGWRVAFLAGQFALMHASPKEPLYLEADYTPGNEAGFRKSKTRVGLYPLTRSR